MSAELLTQASRQIMIEMVSIVFKGLEDIPNVPMTPTTARSLADLAHSPRLQVSTGGEGQGPLLTPFSNPAGPGFSDACLPHAPRFRLCACQPFPADI